MNIVLWTVIGFLSGAIPFSPLLARLFIKTDLRTVGDGNPGGTNVLKAGGVGLGLAALILDYFKGALPVGLAYFIAGIDGWGLVPVALAPLFGHAYSPFLRFRGGKALATTFGIWSGLTIWEGPTILGILCGYWFLSVTNSGWAVLFALASLLAYGLLTGRSDPVWLVIWAANAALLAWRYRDSLAQPPGVRSWPRRLLGRIQR